MLLRVVRTILIRRSLWRLLTLVETALLSLLRGTFCVRMLAIIMASFILFNIKLLITTLSLLPTAVRMTSRNSQSLCWSAVAVKRRCGANRRLGSLLSTALVVRLRLLLSWQAMLGTRIWFLTLTSHNQGFIYEIAAVHAVIFTGGRLCLIVKNRKKGSVICNFGRFLRL